MTGRTKLYDLYPISRGFSAQSVDYEGISYEVAAVSIKQAYYFAAKKIWADNPPAKPAGIITIYRRGAGDPGDWFLWCGCRIYGGLGLQHGDGVRRITQAMRRHLDTHD